MNVSFVGSGAIAGVHAEICRRLGHRLHTVVGRVPESTAAFAREWGFSHWTISAEEALRNSEIDAVFVCSPSELHEAQAGLAIEAGKHVLVELPLAMSYAGGRAIAELASWRKVVVMVAHTERYMPAIRMIRDEIADERLHVHHVLARFLFFRRRHVGWTGRVRSWADNLLWHHSCHVIDTCLWWFGMPPAELLKVCSHVGPPYAATGIPMDLDILIALPDGRLLNIAMSYHSGETGLDYLIVGEERTLHVVGRALLHHSHTLYDPANDHQYVANELQDREFFAAIAEHRAPGVTPADVLPTLAVLQRVQDQQRAE